MRFLHCTVPSELQVRADKKVFFLVHPAFFGRYVAGGGGCRASFRPLLLLLLPTLTTSRLQMKREGRNFREKEGVEGGEIS